MASLKPVERWSFSSWSLYDQCPSKFKKQRLEGRPVIQVETPALVFGKKVHKEGEEFLKGQRNDVSPDLMHFESELNYLKRHGAVAEEPFVFDRYWHELTDWNDPYAWVRGLLDARLDGLVVDFKTGKHYPEHEQQAELYALVTFLRRPELNTITVEFWYTKFNRIESYDFDRKQVSNLLSEWNKRATALMSETVWAPKENPFCDWCEFQEECELYQSYKAPEPDFEGIDVRTLL